MLEFTGVWYFFLIITYSLVIFTCLIINEPHEIYQYKLVSSNSNYCLGLRRLLIPLCPKTKDLKKK